MKKLSLIKKTVALNFVVAFAISFSYGQSWVKAYSTGYYYHTDPGSVFNWSGGSRDGYCDGYGVIQWYDSSGNPISKYVGYLSYGKNQGYGTQYYSNGDIYYQGNWENDEIKDFASFTALGNVVGNFLKERRAKVNLYLSTYLQISEIYGVTGVSIGVTVTNKVNGHRYFNEPYFHLSKPIQGNADTFKLFNEMYNIPFPKRMEFGEQYDVNYNLKAGFLDQMKNLTKQEVTLSAIITTTTGEKFISNPMLIDDLFKYEN